MKSQLIIHFHHDDTISWFSTNQKGHLVNQAEHVSLDAIPLHFKHIIVLIPTTSLLLTNAIIPSKQQQKIVKAIPYALEEQLIDDIDTLHFAIGKKDNQTAQIPVAVIAKNTLQIYLDKLKQQGISPTSIMPDVLAVPLPEKSWGIMYYDNNVLIRTGLCRGFAIEQSLLDITLSMALEEQDISPQQLVVFSGQDSLATKELHTLGLSIVENQHQESIDNWLIETVAQAIPLNLLQGDFQTTKQVSGGWKKWRISLILLILWLVISASIQVIDYQKLQQQRHVLQTEMENIYRQTFPEAKRIVNPRVQMEQKLLALRGQKGNASNNAHFLTLLNPISNVLQQAEGLDIQRLDYQNGQFTIILNIASLQALEQLKQSLAAINFKMTIQSASSHDNKVESYIQIESN